MKIGIYLIGIHHTFLSDFIKILEPDKNEIHLFVSEKLQNLIEDINPEVKGNVKSLLYKGGSLNRYNKQVTKVSEELDYLVISPNSGRKGLLSHLYLKPKCKYTLIDVLFGDAYLDIYHLFKWDPISNKFFRWIYKKQMKNADGLIFSSYSIMEMMKKHLNKKMLFFPFNFYQEENVIKKVDHSKIHITITGTIEPLRKDYKAFFKAVERLISDTEADCSKLKFFFLGGRKSTDNQFANNAVHKAQELNTLAKQELIKTFDDVFVSEKDYRACIAETDLTLSPLNMDHYKYGKFCSGMSESIAYVLPGIYPETYEILPELESSSLKFKDAEDLYAILKEILNNQNLIEDLSQKAKINAKKYSIESYREIFYNFIRE